MQNISSMHLKFGNFVLYTPLYRLTERKNVSMYKTVHAELLVRKQVMCSGSSCTTRQLSNLVGMYSALIMSIMKNIKFGGNKHSRTRSNVFVHTKTPSVTIQGNITAMRYRNDINWSVLLLHIRTNLDMMLAQDYASCHVARSTPAMLVANNVRKFK